MQKGKKIYKIFIYVCVGGGFSGTLISVLCAIIYKNVNYTSL